MKTSLAIKAIIGLVLIGVLEIPVCAKSEAQKKPASAKVENVKLSIFSVSDEPLPEALERLADLAKLNMIVHSQVTGNVTGKFVETTVGEILDSLVTSNGYNWEVGSVVKGSRFIVVKKPWVKRREGEVGYVIIIFKDKTEQFSKVEKLLLGKRFAKFIVHEGSFKVVWRMFSDGSSSDGVFDVSDDNVISFHFTDVLLWEVLDRLVTSDGWESSYNSLYVGKEIINEQKNKTIQKQSEIRLYAFTRDRYLGLTHGKDIRTLKKLLQSALSPQGKVFVIDLGDKDTFQVSDVPPGDRERIELILKEAIDSPVTKSDFRCEARRLLERIRRTQKKSP